MGKEWSGEIGLAVMMILIIGAIIVYFLNDHINELQDRVGRLEKGESCLSDAKLHNIPKK